MTSTPTRPVDNVVVTTKGLQDRNINILDGTTVENKGKLILWLYLIIVLFAGFTYRNNKKQNFYCIISMYMIEGICDFLHKLYPHKNSPNELVVGIFMNRFVQ